MNKILRSAQCFTLASVLALLIPVEAYADSDRFAIGGRFNALAADGEPANDMLGVGVYGYYRLKENWFVGVALDASDFDFERPHKILGLSAKTVDADASSTTVSAWIERRYDRPGKRLDWFWGAGLGFSSVDVDDVTGPTDAGGTFNIKTDVDTETVLLGSIGYRYPFANSQWSLQGALRIEQHLADWEVFDRVSGRVDNIDDYTVKGIHFGIERSF
jgi:hypothetical protein